jgi:5S rRNA maturation endonuclease (ribonuclease M5)
MPQGVVADFSGQDINKGLYNYLRKLQDIAPTYIDRNKTAVAKGYVKAYRAEEKGVKSMQRYTKVKPKEPVYVPTNYGKGESE